MSDQTNETETRSIEVSPVINASAERIYEEHP